MMVWSPAHDRAVKLLAGLAVVGVVALVAAGVYGAVLVYGVFQRLG